MRLDGPESRNVEDRRGAGGFRRGGIAVGGGLGGVALVVIVIFFVLVVFTIHFHRLLTRHRHIRVRVVIGCLRHAQRHIFIGCVLFLHLHPRCFSGRRAADRHHRQN